MKLTGPNPKSEPHSDPPREYAEAKSFRNLFSKLAGNEWSESQIQALQIKASGLQAIAQVETAKTVLKVKPPSK